MNKKKVILLSSIIFLTLIVLFDGLYYFLKFTDMPFSKRFWFKILASVSFVGNTTVNLCLFKKYSKNNKIPSFCIAMLVGQILAASGDIVLGPSFAIGTILFALGHVGYFVAYMLLVRFKPKDLIFIGVVFVFSFLILLLYPNFDFYGLDIIIYIYAAIISGMLGKAISLAFEKNIDKMTRIIIVVGASLFFFSDMMLVFCQFAKAHEITDFLCLLTYYPAEFLLGFSTIVYLKDYNKGE